MNTLPPLSDEQRRLPAPRTRTATHRTRLALLACVLAAAAGCRDDAGGLSVSAVPPAQAQPSAAAQPAPAAAPQTGNASSGAMSNKDQLLQAARQGDTKAAAALYAGASACVSGQRAKEFLARKAREPGSWVNSPEKMQDLSPEQLELAQLQTRRAQEYDANCAQSGETAESGDLYDIARMAADAGDRQAGFCYASATLPRPAAWEQDAAKFAEYRKNAERYIKQGMQAGDWRAVALALESSGGRSHGWLSSVIGPNPEMAYELTRLQRLGADGAVAADLDKQLEIRARTLAPQAATAADRRAETTFRQAFAKAAPFRNDVVACPL